MLMVTVNKNDIMSPAFKDYIDFDRIIIKNKNYICVAMNFHQN